MSVNKIDFADWASTLRAVEGLADYMAMNDGVGLSLWARSVGGETFQTQLPADAVVESLADYFDEAEFWEREMHQMFGVEFDRTESNQPLYVGEGIWQNSQPLQAHRGLTKRNVNPWPGAKEPGEANTPGKRRLLPPGVDAKYLEEDLL
jgi:NADH-quinone oxidoreductase subunit C